MPVYRRLQNACLFLQRLQVFCMPAKQGEGGVDYYSNKINSIKIPKKNITYSLLE